MKLSPRQALETASKKFKISLQPSNTICEYSIVNFCKNYLHLPINETIKISTEIVRNTPIIYIIEDNWGDTLQNFMGTKASQYGNRIRQAAQNKFGVGSTGNAPKIQQPLSNPISKISQGVQNFFNTKGAVLRNSPMIRVDDNTKGVTKYIAFPDLDLERPGHKRVLDSIIRGLSNTGVLAQQINIAAPERAAAEKAGNYSEISTPDSAENKKQAVEASLQQLEDLITTNKETLSKYSFISNEELQNLQNQITQAAGHTDKAIETASKDTLNDTAEIVKDVEQVTEQPNNQPSVYNQTLDKIQSASDLRAEQAQIQQPVPVENNPNIGSQETQTNVPEISPEDVIIPTTEVGSEEIKPENNQEISVEPNKATSEAPTQASTINHPGAPTFNFNASAGPGSLQNQLTNQPQGSIEDTLAANKINAAKKQEELNKQEEEKKRIQFTPQLFPGQRQLEHKQFIK